MGSTAWKAKHKMDGRCVDCSDWALPGRIRCLAHQEALRPIMRRSKAALVKRRRENGLCPMCGYPLHPDADKGRINCIDCREETNRHCR